MTMRAAMPHLALLAAWLAVQPVAAATSWRRPAAVAGFGGIHAELQRVADAEGRMRVNHFCAVVQDVREPPGPASEGNSRQLIVHWPEGGHIFTYGPGYGGRIGRDTRDEGAGIDLREDVVASDKDIAGSATRVTRAFVRGLIGHCRVSGTHYRVVRHAR